jgi:hypothetical protein
MVRRINLVILAALTVAAIACGEGAQSQAAQASPTIEFMTPAPSVAATIATSTATRPATPVPTAPAPASPSPTPTVAVPTPTVAGPPTPVATVPPPPTAAVEAQSAGDIHPVGGAGYQGQCGAYSASVTQWWPVVTQYDWDPCTALEVIETESGGANVYNTQGSGACGVMQLLPCQYPNNGAANIAAGYAKYAAAGGWSPWMSFWG